jgi:hypothetical protein
MTTEFRLEAHDTDQINFDADDKTASMLGSRPYLTSPHATAQPPKTHTLKRWEWAVAEEKTRIRNLSFLLTRCTGLNKDVTNLVAHYDFARESDNVVVYDPIPGGEWRLCEVKNSILVPTNPAQVHVTIRWSGWETCWSDDVLLADSFRLQPISQFVADHRFQYTCCSTDSCKSPDSHHKRLSGDCLVFPLVRSRQWGEIWNWSHKLMTERHGTFKEPNL